MKIRILIIILSLANSWVYAGFNSLTHHSRAACVNNESISWDWQRNHLLRTKSLHYYGSGGFQHTIDTGWQNTWRSAAVHWGEGVFNWYVVGEHWMKDQHGREYLAAQEYVLDCSIYDGWWDKNK